jgi:hypothetical protein
MDSTKNLVRQFEKNPQNVSFDDLCQVRDHYFGEARKKGSHRIYRMPWQGNPRINIQNDHGKAKAYQVKQVVKAIRKLEEG